MAEYVNNRIKIIGIGDIAEMDIPKPIASINFDAFVAGTYMVNVDQDGSYQIILLKTLSHKNEVE